ncbi:hypothetical protein HPP92_010544 [Vanilla planifolia]|uniref:Uncharacterized protein n=1 Tax=Vanilla planifolia TaxID=51239 RepID=A0A835R6P0_VANPL|nr:hypothetical protein HPP92_010544 [Vanilla planifolia]
MGIETFGPASSGVDVLTMGEANPLTSAEWTPNLPKEEPSTPKSETFLLQPPLVCPPAPRKARPARRKPLAGLMPNLNHDAPSFFVNSPTAVRPKKRLRLL